MGRDVRALVIALLCVLAVALAATTLANPQSSGAGTGSGADVADGSTDPQPVSAEDGGGTGSQSAAGQAVQFSAGCYPFLLSPWFLALAAVVVGGAVLVARRRTSTPVAVGLVGFPVLVFGVPTYVVLTACGSETSVTPSETSVLPEMDAASDVEIGGAVGASGTDPSVSLPVLVGVVVVVLVVAVIAYRGWGTASPEDDGEQSIAERADEEPETESLAAMGAAAREAADRIEAAADVDNEVYRAWREMTVHVDVANPDSSTPAEFAAAAEDAGMDRGDVAELTELFRSVRYGGDDPTADREERAVAALRAVEDRYADGDA